MKKVITKVRETLTDLQISILLNYYILIPEKVIPFISVWADICSTYSLDDVSCNYQFKH